MNFSAFITCFIDHFLLVSDFRQVPFRYLFKVFPFFVHCCLCIRNFYCLRHRNYFVNGTVVSHRIHPFGSDVILMRIVYSSLHPWSRALVGITNKSIFCHAFPNTAVSLPTALYRILQGIAAGIGTSNFLRAVLIVSLNSSSFGSKKKIPLNCLVLSSSGFSIAQLCFVFFFAA